MIYAASLRDLALLTLRLGRPTDAASLRGLTAGDSVSLTSGPPRQPASTPPVVQRRAATQGGA